MWVWHYHHDHLLSYLADPAQLDRRRQEILTQKPPVEHALRLRLLQPVRGLLPPRLAQAGEAYAQAREAYAQAWEAYVQAWEAYVQAEEAYVQAWKACMPALDALHAVECPNCPWDGRTIFPRAKSSDSG